MNRVAKTIGLDYATSRKLYGAGTTVAILDTGIHAEHPDFHGSHTPLAAFYDCINRQTTPYDDNGHGTHISGIICGNGKSSGGRVRGIAPECSLVVLKVLNAKGEGNVKDVLHGIDWILQNQKRYRIRIVNISVGSSRNKTFDEDSPLVKAVDSLWDAGLVVTTAAGNHGPERYSIGSPGNSRKIITVGSSDDTVKANIHGKYVRSYSSRGPTSHCIKKPDIVAPGSNIISCNHVISMSHPFSKPVYYTSKSGTSMSTPIVSGALALLLSKEPQLSNLDVKIHLKNCAVDLGYPHERQGWGLLTIPNLLSSL